MIPKYAIILVAIASLVGVAASQTAFGQTIQLNEELELSTDQVIFVIGIGSLAGVIRAWQGYDKSPNDFDWLRFVNGVRDSILISLPVAFGAALALPELHAVGYVMIFFAVVGGTTMAQSARKKSIPSNATPEEIQKVLDERD